MRPMSACYMHMVITRQEIEQGHKPYTAQGGTDYGIEISFKMHRGCVCSFIHPLFDRKLPRVEATVDIDNCRVGQGDPKDWTLINRRPLVADELGQQC
jgi:hypothetical protein